MSQYEISEEVKTLAKELIDRYHQHLKAAKIVYLFRDKAWATQDGKVILGNARKRSEVDKLLGREHEDFLIILGKDKWALSDDNKKKWMVDHELNHCGALVSNKGVVKWIIKKHDVEEFYAMWQRYEFKREEVKNAIFTPPKDPLAGAGASRMIQTTESLEDKTNG
jgi:maltodextrin utilization protein YvdJ